MHVYDFYFSLRTNKKHLESTGNIGSIELIKTYVYLEFVYASAAQRFVVAWDCTPAEHQTYVAPQIADGMAKSPEGK